MVPGVAGSYRGLISLTSVPFLPREKPMPDKTDGGTWAVVRYLPFLDKSEGEFPAHLDGWYADEHTAVTVAKDWASQHPEATVVVVQSVKRTGHSAADQERPLPAASGRRSGFWPKRS
jgi:hypothetical protein